MRPCPQCISPRAGAFIAGTVNLVLGFVGLSLVSLSPKERHLLILKTFDNQGNEETLSVFSEENSIPKTTFYSDVVVEDTLQLFIDYLLPSSGLLCLGLALIVAATTMNRCMAIFSFVLATLIMASSVSGLLSLTLSTGIDLVGAMPLILMAILQLYIYWIVIDLNHFSWEFNQAEDKMQLVKMDKDTEKV